MSVHRLAKTRFGIGLVSLTAIATVFWLVLWATIVPLIFGWSPVMVLTGSMTPNIDSGDIVLGAPYGDEPLSPGKVIVFDNPTGTGKLTHRIVDIAPTGDYVTRGDANGRIDSTPVPPDTIHAVGRYLVPTIGIVFIWANQGAYGHLVAAAIIALAAVWASRWAILARYNPWRNRPPPQLDGSVATIGAVLDVWPTATPHPVATTTQTAKRTPPKPPRTRGGPKQFAIGTATVALVASIALVSPSIEQSEAAFTSATIGAGNSLIADTLNAPTGLTATGGASASIDWTATIDTYATGHRILRSTTPGGPYTQIAEITPRTTVTYNDSPPDGTYYYIARAYHLNWESVNSNESTAVIASGLTYSDTGPSSTRTSSGPLTVTYPAGTQQNDLMLLVEVNAANQNITTPTGWALLADTATSSPSQFRFTIWWRLAAPAETSVDLAVNTSAGGATAWVIRYTRPAGYPPTPITATATIAVGNSGPSTTLTPTPDITTNQPDATVISIVATRDANTLSLSTPEAFDLQATMVQSSTGQPRALGIADQTLLPLPSTPASPTWTQTGTPAQWAWATIAFS